MSSGGGVEVTTATAVRDTLSVTIPAEGRTRARERFAVTAPVSGRLTRLDLEAGDLVEEGQLLGRLFPAPEDPRVVATIRAEEDAAEARYREAEIRLREAEVQALQAEREAERRRPLLELGAITQEQMEQAELAADVADERRSRPRGPGSSGPSPPTRTFARSTSSRRSPAASSRSPTRARGSCWRARRS